MIQQIRPPMVRSFLMRASNVPGRACSEFTSARDKCSIAPTGWLKDFRDLIDRMNENGKDTAALQAALDAFEEALKEAHPVYESAKGIINSHQGFDADGKVTDREKAVETVKELRDKMQEVRGIIGEPGVALREAFKAYRDAHRPADTLGIQG